MEGVAAAALLAVSQTCRLPCGRRVPQAYESQKRQAKRAEDRAAREAEKEAKSETRRQADLREYKSIMKVLGGLVGVGVLSVGKVPAGLAVGLRI